MKTTGPEDPRTAMSAEVSVTAQFKSRPYICHDHATESTARKAQKQPEDSKLYGR
jgi:hypothetical protein